MLTVVLFFHPRGIPSCSGTVKSHSGETQRSVVKSQRIQVGPGMACLFLTGTSEKCIQNEAGDWLTVKEFLNEGGRATSKDWKGVIRCNGETLRHLEQVL